MPPAPSPSRRPRRKPRDRRAGPRSEVLQIRATSDERLAVIVAASLIGLSVTEFMRGQLLQAAERMRVDARPAKTEVTRRRRRGRRGAAVDQRLGGTRHDPLLYDQVRRVGVNLNQITKRLNSMNESAPPELPVLLRELRSLLVKGVG